MYLHQCSIATNVKPKMLPSTLAYIFENQYIKAQLIYTKQFVRDLLVTVSAALSAFTLSLIIKPSPLGSGIFTGNY